MQKRTIKIVLSYDISNYPDMVTPKETVKEMVVKEIENLYGQDEGYCGISVDVIDE